MGHFSSFGQLDIVSIHYFFRYNKINQFFIRKKNFRQKNILENQFKCYLNNNTTIAINTLVTYLLISGKYYTKEPSNNKFNRENF